MRNRYGAKTIMTLLMGFTAPLVAQDMAAVVPEVAHFGLIDGYVWTLQAGSSDRVRDEFRSPVVSGDTISTGGSSSTEIHIHKGNILRLSEHTEVQVFDSTSTDIRVWLLRGLLTLTVVRGEANAVEIATPNVAVRPLREGIYRVEVNPDGETRVIVRNGEVEVAAPLGGIKVGKDELIMVRGTEDPQYRIVQAPPRDAWDDWNEYRERRLATSQNWCLTPSLGLNSILEPKD